MLHLDTSETGKVLYSSRLMTTAKNPVISTMPTDYGISEVFYARVRPQPVFVGGDKK